MSYAVTANSFAEMLGLSFSSFVVPLPTLASVSDFFARMHQARRRRPSRGWLGLFFIFGIYFFLQLPDCIVWFYCACLCIKLRIECCFVSFGNSYGWWRGQELWHGVCMGLKECWRIYLENYAQKKEDGMVESIVRFSVLGMMNCLCSCLFLTFLTSLLCIIYMIQMLIQ